MIPFRYAPCLLVPLVMAAWAAPAAAQSEGWVLPRTPDGRPDLQGNWTNATVTPLERPVGAAPVLSAEEVERIEQNARRYLEASIQPSDPNRPPPPVGGDGSTGAAGGVGGYDGVYIDRGDRIAWVDGEPRTSLLTIPSNGRVPPVLPEARDARAAALAATRRWGPYDHPEMRPLGERCIMSFGSNAGPPMLPNGFYNNNYTIVQTQDHVAIMTEMIHDTRIIRIGDGPRLPPHVRPWMGDSHGWWEGDTLVVETTNFHPDQQLRGMPSENLKVTERFTRADAETILYEFLVEDSTVWTEPWGGQIPFISMGDELIYEYACHEGNYALANVLSGARYQERQAESNPSDPRE